MSKHRNYKKTLHFAGFKVGNQLVKDILDFIEKHKISKTLFLTKACRYFLSNNRKIVYTVCGKCGSDDLVPIGDKYTCKDCKHIFQKVD